MSPETNRKTRIFLTNPPLNMAETPLQYHRPLIPLGLAYLGAVLEDALSGGAWEMYVQNRLAGLCPKGYRPTGAVAAVDNMFSSFYGKFSLDRLLEKIRAHAEGIPPEGLVIGLSVLSDGMWAAKQMLLRMRREFPLASIIVGGPHATLFPYDFYQSPTNRQGPLADYVVRNEGEGAIVGIIEGALRNARDLKDNAERFGIDMKNSDYSDPDYRIIDGGQYRASSGTIGLHSLDDLPTPAYFLFEDREGLLTYEPDRRYGLASPAANINSSRGCPHKCTFCTIPKLAPGYRTLSPKRMLQTVRFLANDYGIKSLFFREDNFMYSGGTLEGDRWGDIEEFCTGLKDSRLDVRWAIEARADNLLQSAGAGKARVDVLAAAGLSGVYIGVESGSDVMLKLYAKGADTMAMSEAINACRSRNVAVVATSCYSDPDLLLKSRYPLIDPSDPTYQRGLIQQRETILTETRSFMDKHDIPLERREEYAMVGIPISTTYNVLAAEKERFPWLIEHQDTCSRYLYPKGFTWWATKIYETKKLVRPYIGFDYRPPQL